MNNIINWFLLPLAFSWLTADTDDSENTNLSFELNITLIKTTAAVIQRLNIE